MKNRLVFTLLIFSFLQFYAQSSPYADVAVIVNDNSLTSLAIGSYFAQQRGISPNRILHVTTTTALDVDSLGFEDMRAQIEAALISGNLLDTVQYLVTTRGMPARVSIRQACDSSLTFLVAIERCTCLESELSMILGPLSNEILRSGLAPNPYSSLQLPTHPYFERDSFGIFLISRLDGFDVQAAQALVDHGGPDRPFVIADAQIVLDVSGFSQASGIGPYFAGLNSIVRNDLTPVGYQFIDDMNDSTFTPLGMDVISYSAAHRENPMLPLAINMDFLPGSSAHLVYDLEPIGVNGATRYTAGDAIGQGAAVVTGLVANGYSSPNYFANRFLDVYHDTITARRYNAAEAFFLSQNLLGHQSVLYGDPKTSILPVLMIARENPLVQQFAIYPNPTTARFTIQLLHQTKAAADVKVMDMQGKVLLTDRFTGDAKLDLNVSDLAGGMYLVQVQMGSAVFTRKLSVLK
jgi:uncharacterized protein (TIGR03790 family)